MAEAYRWLAHYDDGSVYPETDPETGAGRSFTTVAGHRTVAVELAALVDGVPARLLVDVRPEQGEQPVCFRRRTCRLDLATGETIPEATLTVVGVEGPAGSRYCFVTEDGTVVLTGTRDPV